MHNKCLLQISGKNCIAIEPTVISASRSTDIPAFHSDWFINRLEVGYVRWTNPFNRQHQYISLDKVKFIIFWTKNPEPIIPYLDHIRQKGISFYFQYTLNDYEKENLEPRVPLIKDRIESFIKLSQKIGKEKVIWRFDPLILSNNIDIETLIEKIYRIGKELHTYTDKLVFSFIDINTYSKVKMNLASLNEGYREFTEAETIEFASRLSKMAAQWKIQLATCGEKTDLENHGIKHNKCIDDKLILKIAPNDQEICRILRRIPKQASLISSLDTTKEIKLKDKGQRKECGCITSKDIGHYNTCMHLCKYCYANHSESIVKKNSLIASTTRDSIIP